MGNVVDTLLNASSERFLKERNKCQTVQEDHERKRWRCTLIRHGPRHPAWSEVYVQTKLLPYPPMGQP